MQDAAIRVAGWPNLAIGNAVRILQLISSAGYYGAEAVATSLSLELGKLGHEVVLGIFENSHNPHLEIAGKAREHNLALEIIRCQGKMDRKAIHAVRRCVAEHHIDVMHTHGYKSDLYGIAAASRLRVPVVATCHNWTGASLPLRLYSILDRAVLHRAQHIAAVSEQVRRKLVQFAIPKAKIRVIANGVAIDSFRNARPALREEFGLDQRPVVGVVGRLSSEKGHRFLLHAAQQLAADFPDIAFLFVGAGTEQAALESLARRLNLTERIFLAGFRDHMPDVYASMDILALPSLKEGSPLVLLEAMAAALPVVATKVGDVGKIVVSGDSGLLVEPGNPQALRDALARLLADPGFRRRLAAGGQRCVAEHFSAASMAQKYVHMYEDALGCALAPSERTEPAAV